MGKPLNVLITGYEAAPFYKRGGLGDVMESLPKALRNIGVDARVVIPYYKNIAMEKIGHVIGEFFVEFDAKQRKISVYETHYSSAKVPVYFLQNPYLDTDNIHDENKRIDQFAFFALAVSNFVNFLKQKQWIVSVVHCNDWHTALIPLLFKKKLGLSTKTLLTIHNLVYQGIGSIRVLDLLGVTDKDTKEIKRGVPAREVDVLGEGILHADAISTVSPTYAQEIIQQEEDHHQIIYGYLRRRDKANNGEHTIVGILNGIDYDVWNPSHDPYLSKTYTASNWSIGKRKNKEELLKSLGFHFNRPTFCFVGRMAAQKGIDILIQVIPKMVKKCNVNIIILGSGDSDIERSVQRMVKQYPSHVAAVLSYNEEIGHRFYGGSDFILIPSHYEPCGLIQMIAMRYGTLPIASATGGLKDSIMDGKNGFLFQKDSPHALFKAVEKALNVYNNSAEFKTMVGHALQTDFSWKKSALLYKKLYLNIIEG